MLSSYKIMSKKDGLEPKREIKYLSKIKKTKDSLKNHNLALQIAY